MWEWINETLCAFRKCFTREAAFRWFVVVVLGFIVRSDSLGVTSFIRGLFIDPQFYHTVLHFFRANSWCLDTVRTQWLKIVLGSGNLFCEMNMPILVGDGVKQSKEGKRMPSVKRLFQESEDSSKPSYIFGHMFGSIGALVGSIDKLFCVPLYMTIHDGVKQIGQWTDSNDNNESHVVRIIRDASRAASILGHSILLLDRYFLTVPALTVWLKEEQSVGHRLLTIITKAKSNAIAYEDPAPRTGKKGRPQKKGNAIKLSSLFTEFASSFKQATVMMYGKEEGISFFCKDLLWGKQLYTRLRFVLVKYGETKSILVSTDLSLSPEQIIRLYSYRFKIESCFREFKQVITGFTYHFWSKEMPKLNKYAKSGTDPLEQVTDEKAKEKIIAAWSATERFVMTACIAMGLTQICSVRFSDMINRSAFRWLRTKSNKIPSESTTADFMRKTIFHLFNHLPDLVITRLIRAVQSEHSVYCDSLSA